MYAVEPIRHGLQFLFVSFLLLLFQFSTFTFFQINFSIPFHCRRHHRFVLISDTFFSVTSADLGFESCGNYCSKKAIESRYRGDVMWMRLVYLCINISIREIRVFEQQQTWWFGAPMQLAANTKSMLPRSPMLAQRSLCINWATLSRALHSPSATTLNYLTR